MHLPTLHLATMLHWMTPQHVFLYLHYFNWKLVCLLMYILQQISSLMAMENDFVIRLDLDILGAIG
jgi:hypothetical protein